MSAASSAVMREQRYHSNALKGHLRLKPVAANLDLFSNMLLKGSPCSQSKLPKDTPLRRVFSNPLPDTFAVHMFRCKPEKSQVQWHHYGGAGGASRTRRCVQGGDVHWGGHPVKSWFKD